MINVHMHSSVHENARIVSAQFAVGFSRTGLTKALLEEMVRGMERINAWADGADAIIGHLKAYIQWPGNSVMLTTTGTDVQVKGAASLPIEPVELDVGVTGIIYGPSLKDVEKQIQSFVEAVLDNFGLEYELSYECHDENCTLEHHHHESGHGHSHHDHNHDQCDHDHSHDSCECNNEENHEEPKRRAIPVVPRPVYRVRPAKHPHALKHPHEKPRPVPLAPHTAPPRPKDGDKPGDGKEPIK